METYQINYYFQTLPHGHKVSESGTTTEPQKSKDKNSKLAASW